MSGKTPTEIKLIDDVISAAEKAREACEGRILELEAQIALLRKQHYPVYYRDVEIIFGPGEGE
jgi:hypothetical protein